jgi:hypothetical protein
MVGVGLQSSSDNKVGEVISLVQLSSDNEVGVVEVGEFARDVIHDSTIQIIQMRIKGYELQKKNFL